MSPLALERHRNPRPLPSLHEFFAPGGILALCPNEALMHIHGIQTNLNTVSPYAAAEKAVAAQRAAIVRKKLAMSASEIEGNANPEEASMVGKWMNDQYSHALPSSEYHTANAGKDSSFG